MKKEIKIGIVALLALVVAYFGFSFLMGIQVFNSGPTYHAVYQSANGITQDKDIIMNGITVGKVTNVELDPTSGGRVFVSFFIDHENVRVTDSTVARISSLDLFGSKAIVLSNTGAGNYLEDGDTLIAESESDLRSAVDERLRPLEQKTNSLIGSVDSLVTSIQIILDEDTRNNLSSSFKRINSTVSIFEGTVNRVDTIVESEAKRLDSIMYNVNSITYNLEQNSGKINKIIHNFSSISDSLAKANIAQTFSKAGNAMERTASIMEKIDKGEGTAGMLINNDSLYHQLNEASLELDKLLEDIRVNPERYMHFSVFGRKDKSGRKPKKKER